MENLCSACLKGEGRNLYYYYVLHCGRQHWVGAVNSESQPWKKPKSQTAASPSPHVSLSDSLSPVITSHLIDGARELILHQDGCHGWRCLGFPTCSSHWLWTGLFVIKIYVLSFLLCQNVKTFAFHTFTFLWLYHWNKVYPHSLSYLLCIPEVPLTIHQ